jgi:hypothetical protein
MGPPARRPPSCSGEGSGEGHPPRRTGHPIAGRPAVPAGGDARPSRANVRYPATAQLPRRSHSPLTACPGPRRAGHGRWQGGDAPSARAASLASTAALPVPAAGQPWPRRGTPTLIPTRISTLIPTPATRVPPHRPRAPFALVMPLVGLVGRKNRGRLAPLGGSGAARPQGALRAIDSSAWPRSWRTCGPRRLRRQSQAGPGCHAR